MVVLGHPHEAELFVVMRTDELGGIDGAILQRRVDVGMRKVERQHADTGEDRPTQMGSWPGTNLFMVVWKRQQP